MIRLRFLWLIITGRADDAFKLVVDRRVTVFGVRPRDAQLVRAGLCAGRLLERAPVPVPSPRPSLRLVR